MAFSSNTVDWTSKKVDFVNKNNDFAGFKQQEQDFGKKGGKFANNECDVLKQAGSFTSKHLLLNELHLGASNCKWTISGLVDGGMTS